jgi:hypothetical protein
LVLSHKTSNNTPKNNNNTNQNYTERKFKFKKASSNSINTHYGNVEISLNDSYSKSNQHNNTWHSEYSTENIVYIDLENIKNDKRLEIKIEDNEENEI